MRRHRVLLADDHRLLREAFVKLLEPTCDVVGTVRVLELAFAGRGDSAFDISLCHNIGAVIAASVHVR